MKLILRRTWIRLLLIIIYCAQTGDKYTGVQYKMWQLLNLLVYE